MNAHRTSGFRAVLAGIACASLVVAASGCGLAPRTPLRVTVVVSPSEGAAPLAATFRALVEPASATSADLVYVWTIDSQPADAGNSTLCWTLDEPGTHSAAVAVTDRAGRTAAAAAEVVVLNAPPIASFRLSNDAPLVGEWVVADASGSWDPDGNLADAEWRFGDGSVASGFVSGHAYSEEGSFAITLRVVDRAGASSEATHRVLVHRGSPGGGGCSGGGVGLR